MTGKCFGWEMTENVWNRPGNLGINREMTVVFWNSLGNDWEILELAGKWFWLGNGWGNDWEISESTNDGDILEMTGTFLEMTGTFFCL